MGHGGPFSFFMDGGCLGAIDISERREGSFADCLEREEWNKPSGCWSVTGLCTADQRGFVADCGRKSEIGWCRDRWKIGRGRRRWFYPLYRTEPVADYEWRRQRLDLWRGNFIGKIHGCFVLCISGLYIDTFEDDYPTGDSFVGDTGFPVSPVVQLRLRWSDLQDVVPSGRTEWGLHRQYVGTYIRPPDAFGSVWKGTSRILFIYQRRTSSG